ncbi:MAG: 16S rRNA (cytosine(1402)-N(4))-methyltransferase RsmH [Verrucomicrobiota bacterium]
MGLAATFAPPSFFAQALFRPREENPRTEHGGGKGGHPRLPSWTVTSHYHTSVLLDETIKFLQPDDGKRIVDGTLGGGGHAFEMLEHGAQVIGFDRDPEALEEARSKCWSFEGHFVALRGNFADFGDTLDDVGISKVDGVLLDLGISSHQIDEPNRGFSFQSDGPLDMRMDPDWPRSAADIINEESEQELKRIFRDYGEERAAARIAHAIVKRRASAPILRTSDLVEVIEKVRPRSGRQHPATKVFQALRIEVNGELDNLQRGLDSATQWLRPGGRLAVITFHSLEDRIVKQYFKRRSRKEIDRPEWPAPKPNPDLAYSIVTKKPIVATSEEIERNPRARSAKLRVAERQEVGA